MLKIKLENIRNLLKMSNFILRRLLVVNVAVNTLMHALLWAALTGACSQVIILITITIIIIIIIITITIITFIIIVTTSGPLLRELALKSDTIIKPSPRSPPP